MNVKSLVRIFAIVIVAFALVGGAYLAAVQPVSADLPTRPQKISTPTQVDGAAIELLIQSAIDLDWTAIETVVQWQDGGMGDWHDVEGWRGALDQVFSDGGRKTWWLDARHFGTGPFRWAIYMDGAILGTSKGFYMPAARGQIVRVSITIE